jgi:putative ABC transport system permease protein
MADLSRRSGDGAKADSGTGDLPRRVAWWLVWAYPPRFRRDVGQGLVDALDDRMRARRAAGASSTAVWARAIADTLRNAGAEWVDEIQSIGREVRLKPDTTYHHVSHQEPLHAENLGYVVSGFSRTSDHTGRTTMDKLLQDVRYAFRLWRRRPGFAFVAILTLALGIGANTAMFSIVNAVLLRPLPYPNADRLVSVYGQTTAFPRGLLSYDEYEEIRKQADTFESVALWFPQSVNLTGVDEPQRLVGSFVTGSFFDVLGLKAERGRFFTEEESAPGTVKPVVVITHQTWQRRFNGDASAIGKTMTLNGVPLTVVGIIAPPFDADSVPSDGYFLGADVFIPTAQFPAPRGLHAAGPVMLGVGRLKPGVNVARAASDLEVIRQRLVAAGLQPSAGGQSSFVAQSGRTLGAEPAQEAIIGTSRTALFLLLASVGVVLLIACVNVSQLLLARAVDREREIALRVALGASRSAVTRQLAVEAALLAATASISGFLLGRWALAGLSWLQPPASVPIPTHVPLDARVLLFTGVVALLTATMCGLAPALRSARPNISRVLQAGSRRASGIGHRTRDVLMVIEVGFSVTLVAVSVLLIQSLLAVQQAPLGFDQSNVFTLQFRLPQNKYPKPENIARFFKSAIENVRAIPNVESAALVRAVPFSGNGGTVGYAIEGQPAPDPASAPQARFHIVTPDYFKTMRIPLLKGRDFTDRDDLQTPLVAVINDTFARRAWPGDDPIGKRFTTPQTPGPITVIGIVGDAKHYTAAEPAVPQLYAAHYQVPLIFSSLVARIKGPAAGTMSVTNDIRKAIWAVDKDQPMWAVASLDATVARTQGQARFLALLLGIFAGVALLLAGVGIYGVTSYGVAQRTHEIGIRLALGASSERVLREVVGRGARLTLVGVAAGIVAAIMMARLAAAVLFAVKPTDPLALALAAAILGGVSVAACVIPARRASRVDPVVALAEE